MKNVPSFPKPTVTVTCGIKKFRLVRWQTFGTTQPWTIDVWNPARSDWSPQPDALAQILLAPGITLLAFSPSHVEWRVGRCTATYRACLVGWAWIIARQEWGNPQWLECDRSALELALGSGALAASGRNCGAARQPVFIPLAACEERIPCTTY